MKTERLVNMIEDATKLYRKGQLIDASNEGNVKNVELLTQKLTPEELTEEIDRREKLGWVPTITSEGIAFVRVDAEIK